MKQGLADILKKESFIHDYSIVEDDKQNIIKIQLKYRDGSCAIIRIEKNNANPDCASIKMQQNSQEFLMD